MTNRERFDAARRDISTPGANLCRPFTSVLPISGASVSVLVPSFGQSTLCSTDATAERLDEIQFDLGEGPCWEALSTKSAVEVDVRRQDGSTWPAFFESVRGDARTGVVDSLYALPLSVGSLELGAVDLYTTEPMSLSADHRADASALAQLVSWQVLRQVLGAAGHEGVELESAPSRREVHQATGMVLAQAGVTAEEAALLLRAHAFATSRTVLEVATDVVERRLAFEQDPGHTP